MSYATEFPAEYGQDIPRDVLNASKWNDVSYGNDVCPRFALAALPAVQVWVDNVDPERRELGGLRFTLVRYHADECTDSTELATSDEWQDIRAVVLYLLALAYVDAQREDTGGNCSALVIYYGEAYDTDRRASVITRKGLPQAPESLDDPCEVSFYEGFTGTDWNSARDGASPDGEYNTLRECFRALVSVDTLPECLT